MSVLPRPESLKIDLSRVRPAVQGATFNFGTASGRGRPTIQVDRTCLWRDGTPWLPTMGEFHYSRYPQEEWRDELLKIKAGGIEIVATYVFWIHHEEIRGEFDFTGCHELRRFIELCKELDLALVLRIGPWAHGEVRNGGLPEWLLNFESMKLRSDDPAYLACVRPFYHAIAKQAAGLLWKDGGPIIGVQLENEYWGEPQHLITLKRMAVEVGFDVPLYTRTGWPQLAGPMPVGHMLPLHGGYAEGFWDRELTSMPGNYWRDFFFSHQREAGSVGTDHFGLYEVDADEEALHYPFLTCELGGGMMSSYHRRIVIDPLDVLTMAIIKIGSGSNLPGYYMYHGGVNPESKTGLSLNERQSSLHTNYNDLPEKTYDFQAPIGECGQLRPHYHLLRRLHLFLRDFGSEMALMPSVLPELRPTAKDDVQTLRWAVRSDGHSGFLFWSNHHRGLAMPEKQGVAFDLKLADGSSMTIPSTPIRIPEDAVGIWPINLRLDEGIVLAWATAQSMCRLDKEHLTVLAASPGIPAELAFDTSVTVEGSFQVEQKGGWKILRVDPSAPETLLRVRTQAGTEHRILVLHDDIHPRLYKLQVAGQEHLLETAAEVLADGDQLRLRVTRPAARSVLLFPVPMALKSDAALGYFSTIGPFASYGLPGDGITLRRLEAERLRAPGPLRTISIGSAGVAEQPSEGDFEAAAVYRIHIPADGWQSLLRINYIGDVARIYLGDRFLTDNFYNGLPFDIPLWRYAANPTDPLLLKVLPLQKDAPICLPSSAKASFEDDERVHLAIRSVELFPRRDVQLSFSNA